MNRESSACLSCLRIVRKRQEALLCDGCNLWQHRVCGTGRIHCRTGRGHWPSSPKQAEIPKGRDHCEPFVDMWLNFVGRGDFFMRDGFHLTGKGAAVLACEFVRVVDEGTGGPITMAENDTSKDQTKKAMDVGRPGRMAVEDIIFLICKDAKMYS
ncbi:hypothetical protein LSAT2_024514 [Lamellibrachia satsuma]|nr:hypothetical protein LSAT2_024514 [Lamellibrachia satsuma]